MTQSKHTPLHAEHEQLGAHFTNFGGWDMPLRYGSELAEHRAVREAAGLFDLSHMGEIWVSGDEAPQFLNTALVGNLAVVKPGRAKYSLICNEQGGIIDDLIIYYLAEDWFRLVVNASTREKDLAWIGAQAGPFGVEVRERPELAMIAVQGPNARERVLGLIEGEDAEAVGALGKFAARDVPGTRFGDLFIARTGYTGEDGFEVIVPEAGALSLWDALLQAGVKPAGLGARDTLRLEAGLNLYGQDMDETVSPFEAALGWTVALDEGRDFIGRPQLEQHRRDGAPRQMVGLVMDEKGVLRHGQRVLTGSGDGEILSGTFSPTLGKAIAFARVPAGDVSKDVRVDIRGREVPVRVVRFPFVRDGKAL